MLFDTHKFYKTLTSEGVPPEQAEAFTKAHNEAFSEASEKELATKQDVRGLESKVTEDFRGLESKVTEDFRGLESKVTEDVQRLERKIAHLEHKITLIQWMVGLVIVAQVIPLLQKLFS